MKKSKSKKKNAAGSKNRQNKKVPNINRGGRKVTKLCSCVASHQLSSDSSSEDLGVKGQPRSSIDIQLPVPAYMKQWTSEDELASIGLHVSDESNRVNLRNSTTLLDEEGNPHSENASSIMETKVQTNRRPHKTRSSELIRLFYTIVADDASFLSEPSDSEDSVTSDVHHEIEVDVHHDDASDDGIDRNPKGNPSEEDNTSLQNQAVTRKVDTASESSSGSDIDIKNVSMVEADKGTWFATGQRYEFSPSTADSQGENVWGLTYSTEEIGYCELSPPAAAEEVILRNSYIACNGVELEEYTDFDYQEEQNTVFKNETSLYVIEEVSEEDCEVTGNISVDTVKGTNSPCQCIDGVADTNLNGLETQLSLVDSTDIPDSTVSDEALDPSKDAAVVEDMNDGFTTDNRLDQGSDEQTRPVQLLNTTRNPEEGSMAFSQDQAVTEIIATGSRMVDEVKELISELLDICMQSRGNDVAPVAAHGDFAKSTSSLAENNNFIETQTDDLGDNVTGVSANSPRVTQSNYNEALAEDPEDRDNQGEDSINIFEPAGTYISTSDGLDVQAAQCEHHDHPFPLQVHVSEPISNSSNTRCAEATSSSPEPQQERQPESATMDIYSNPASKSTDYDDDNNQIELPMSKIQQDTADEPQITSDNATHNSMLLRTDEVWPVKKIKGYDLSLVNTVQETSDGKFYQESTEILKIIGVDIEQESVTEESRLNDIASEEYTLGDEPNLDGNQTVKIIGLDLPESSAGVDGINNSTLKNESVGKVGQPLNEIQITKIVVVDGENHPTVDEICTHDIKIIGVDLETQLSHLITSDSSPNSMPVDEEGDSTRMNDITPCDSDVGNVASESEICTQQLLLEGQCEDILNKSTDVAGCAGDTNLASDGSVCEETISTESGEVNITGAVKTSEISCDSQPGYICVAEVPSNEATDDENQIPRRGRNKENNGFSDFSSFINHSQHGSSGSPCLSHSPFEIVSHDNLQEVMEDGFVMVHHSPSINVPLPQEEYNEELMSPEFEADDIVVNIATVSAMGDVPPAPRRSGLSPIAPSPDPVHFEDVNSRSPSPLPRTDLDILDCLFDICENSLQRFQVKIPPLKTEPYINPKSKPQELSPDCLDEQGDCLQTSEKQNKFVLCGDLSGALSGDDSGFFCCDPASSESYCSLWSTDAFKERPMMTEQSPERFFSFDTFGEAIETEQETLPSQTESNPGIGFQLNVDQVIFCESLNRESDVSHREIDDAVIPQVTKDPLNDNQEQSENTSGIFDLPPGRDKQEEAEENFVFFLALFTFSLFVYCKYGTCVLKTVMHWIWICQLIIQLVADL